MLLLKNAPDQLRGISLTIDEVLDEVICALQNSIEDFKVQIEQGTDDRFEHTISELSDQKKLRDLHPLEVRQRDEKIKCGIPGHIFEKLNAKTVADIEDITKSICEAKYTTPVYVDIHENPVTFEVNGHFSQIQRHQLKAKNDLIKVIGRYIKSFTS